MEYDRPLFYRLGQYAAGADRDVIDMVSGNPDWDPPDSLREGLAAYAESDPEAFQYPPSEGLTELREEIAARRNVPKEQVIVTNGAGEATYLAMARALDRVAGSEVLLPDPVYPYYPGTVELLGGKPRYVSVGNDGRLEPGTVRDRAGEQTACIVANSPNNPTGAVYRRNRASAPRLDLGGEARQHA